MTTILKKSFIIRRLRYLSNRNLNDLLCHSKNELKRTSVNAVSAFLPPKEDKFMCKEKDRELVRLEGLFVCPIIKGGKHNFNILDIIAKVFSKISPNGNGKDISEEQKERNAEVQKLQDIRERTMQHPYEHQSVWQAMKDRDKIRNKEPKSNDDNDNDNK